MYRLLLALAVAIALPRSASADGFYFTEAFGGTKVSDRLADRVADGVRVRAAIGWRAKRFALEGFVAGLANDGNTVDGRYVESDSLFTYGVELKYLHPISQRWEVYLRGSASRGELISTEDDYSGRGLGLGAGIQVKGKVPAAGLLFWPLFFVPDMPGPKITAAAYLDDGFEFYRLHPGGRLDATPAIDGKLSHLTIGFAVGSDF